MNTATTFRTDSATRRTKECMLIAFGLLLSAPALVGGRQRIVTDLRGVH